MKLIEVIKDAAVPVPEFGTVEERNAFMEGCNMMRKQIAADVENYLEPRFVYKIGDEEVYIDKFSLLRALRLEYDCALKGYSELKTKRKKGYIEALRDVMTFIFDMPGFSDSLFNTLRENKDHDNT